ncbi:MAG: tetratricopeptide repeat protein [Roseiflexaceae bacterium]|nr:tetratricopeptide repeat protein [Roseiflexaceae bacterium]
MPMLLVVASAFFCWLAAPTRALDRLLGTGAFRASQIRARPTERVTVIENGEPVDVPLSPRIPKRSLSRRLRDKLPPPSYSSFALAVLALVVVGLSVALPRSLLAPREQFTVLVAPFGDGQASETGRQAAHALAATLNEQSNGLWSAVTINELPRSPAEGVSRLAREGADVLIYGTIAPGAVIDQPSLSPLLLYQPTGGYAPLAWDGYSGRFAMPSAYALSAEPINGSAVLPPLLRALARYSTGDVDSSFDELGTLMASYPALAQPLPRAIRGNILWAAGNYAAAAEEYQRTGVLSIQNEQPSEMALLANNLGAIYQDAGDQVRADQAFTQAEALLGGQALPELQVNRARTLISRHSYADAVALLEPLRRAELNIPTAFTLIDAYLGSQRYEDAQLQLEQSQRQIAPQAERSPAAYAKLVQQRFELAAAERTTRLQLGTAIGASDQLLWELMSGQALSDDELNQPQQDLETIIRRGNELESSWQQVSAAADVDRQPYLSQIANNQVRLANSAERQRRKLLTAVDLNLLRERGAGGGLLDSVVGRFGGEQVRTAAIVENLDAILAAEPNDLEALVLLGFTHNVGGERDQARQTFEQANQLAPTRPEPAYGLAEVALPDDRPQAKAQLNEALRRDANFYLARTRLATLSEQDQEWPAAVEQRRWLATNRGSTADVLGLATALQQSGPAGYAEAEQTLLPLANANNADALVQLSSLYIAAGDVAAAELVLDRARTASPEDPEIAYQRGQALEQLGRTAEAQAEYAHAISLDGNYAQARIALGELYAANTQYEQAAREYDVALRSGTDDPATLQEIGRVLLIAGENRRAVEAYQRAAELAESDPAPYLGLARAHLQMGEANEAVRAAETAIQLAGGTNAQAYVALGDASLLLGDAPGALGHFIMAEQQDPNLAAAKLGRGRAAAAVGEWAVAQSYFQQAIRMDAQLAEARLWNGEALLQQNDIEGARNEYQAALTLRPNYPEAQYGVAKAQAAAGQLAEAHQSLARALELRRDYAAAFVLDGVVSEQQGDRNAARQAYDKAIAADNSSAEAHYRRGLLDIADSNTAGARRELEAAVRLRSNFAEAHYWLGRAYLGEGQPEQADEQFALALVHSNQNYPEAQYYQGVAREQMGDIASAFAAYQAALNQATNSAWAQEAQAALTRLGR